MDASGYTTLTRQSGLMHEMQIIANNIANANTAGFRQEGLIFSEHVMRMQDGPSLSMAHGTARKIDLEQGAFSQTGGAFDLAIEGGGFFLVDTPAGQRLTRAGIFTPSAEGNLVTTDGYPVLDAGGAPILVPQNGHKTQIAPDGTMSIDGVPYAQIGLWQPEDPTTLRRDQNTLFSADNIEPSDNGMMRQGFLENSNVNPITEIARMIEVQRAYELGQKFLEQDGERTQNVIQTLGR